MRGISLSIGHSRGFGLAAIVSEERWVVGVDIETRSSLSARLRRRVLTAREKRRVGRRPPGLRGQAALEHWVLKEAALKTTGGGVAKLISTPGAVEVIRLSRRGWGLVTLSGVHPARGRLIQTRGLTMAVVLLRR
jgi:phosphopantetheinyl transferase